MTKRKRQTRKDRERILVAAGGLCHICGGAITGYFEVEHIIPFALTQDDGDSNLRPAHPKCHRTKTDEDVGRIAKAERQRAKHLGTWPKSRQPIKGRGFDSLRLWRPAPNREELD